MVSYSQTQDDTALFEAVFTEDIRALRPVFCQAKETLLANGSAFEETTETFLLFGNPAMKLKVPLPRRPSGVSAQSNSGGITIRWNGATDCDGGAVSGYNLYGSTTPGGDYTKRNTSLIAGTQYTDPGAFSVSSSSYVVSAVDSDGDESVPSLTTSPAGSSTQGAGSFRRRQGVLHCHGHGPLPLGLISRYAHLVSLACLVDPDPPSDSHRVFTQQCPLCSLNEICEPL